MEAGRSGEFNKIRLRLPLQMTRFVQEQIFYGQILVNQSTFVERQGETIIDDYDTVNDDKLIEKSPLYSIHFGRCVSVIIVSVITPSSVRGAAVIAGASATEDRALRS